MIMDDLPVERDCLLWWCACTTNEPSDLLLWQGNGAWMPLQTSPICNFIVREKLFAYLKGEIVHFIPSCSCTTGGDWTINTHMMSCYRLDSLSNNLSWKDFHLALNYIAFAWKPHGAGPTERLHLETLQYHPPWRSLSDKTINPPVSSPLTFTEW